MAFVWLEDLMMDFVDEWRVSVLMNAFGHSRGVQNPFINKIMCS
jgi:hypothetical protein